MIHRGKVRNILVVAMINVCVTALLCERTAGIGMVWDFQLYIIAINPSTELFRNVLISLS